MRVCAHLRALLALNVSFARFTLNASFSFTLNASFSFLLNISFSFLLNATISFLSHVSFSLLPSERGERVIFFARRGVAACKVARLCERQEVPYVREREGTFGGASSSSHSRVCDFLFAFACVCLRAHTESVGACGSE